MCSFCFVFLLCWKKGKGKYEKMEKENFKKAQENCILWVVVKKNGLCKNVIFWKIGKHYLCSEGKKRAFSLQLSVFGKWSFFLWPFQVTKHSKNRGFSRHRGKPKRDLWLQKCHFGKGPRKGSYYLWCLKAVLCWKHYIYSVFSKTQLCRHERA